MTVRILVIDDDARLLEMLEKYLTDAGYQVEAVPDGQSGLEAIRSTPFDAIVLDLMLPDIDGLEICKSIRAENGPPILMLTAKGDPLDRVIGLELGAEDYLPKPFEPRELLARLKIIMRRRQGDVAKTATRFGRLEIDRGAMEARLDGKRCDITAYQFQLLDALSQSAGRVLSRDFLMNALQGEDLEAFDRSIDVHISRIRSAVEDDPGHPRRIITVRGAGYLFARSQE
ncbi:MAG: response regulator transcription factor [Pseudomonadota bacterium]